MRLKRVYCSRFLDADWPCLTTFKHTYISSAEQTMTRAYVCTRLCYERESHLHLPRAGQTAVQIWLLLGGSTLNGSSAKSGYWIK